MADHLHKSSPRRLSQMAFNSESNSDHHAIVGDRFRRLSYSPLIINENKSPREDYVRMYLPFNKKKASERRSTCTDLLNCSQQSILSVMDRFVKSVTNMNSTVLVPSKLRDMDMQGKKIRSPTPPLLADNSDPYNFYYMLNDVKKELLWGPGSTSTTTPATTTTTTSHAALLPQHDTSSSNNLIKNIGQETDDNLGSLGSSDPSSSSSSNSDTDNSDMESMYTTDRESVDEHSFHLAAAFRHHLQGLHAILNQLADSSDFLSSRYQEDIDSSI